MSDPNLKHPLGEDYTASQERLSKVARIDGFSDEEEEGGHESESPENPRVQRYLVAVEYVGTRFFGSQQQPKYRTVVGVLQVNIFLSGSFIA